MQISEMSNPGASRSGPPSSSSNMNRQQPQMQQHLSSGARNHLLYPMLDTIAKTSFQAAEGVRKLEGNVHQLREEVKVVQSAIKELRELMQAQTKSSYSLKEEGHEVRLRTGIAEMFCKSATREILDDDFSALIKKVLKQDAQHRYKSDAARKYCKKTFSVFKTEERRRIFGIAPCQQHCHWSTERLAYSLMDYMKAPEASTEIYRKHLALIRKFIRDVPNAQSLKQFHMSFKKWIDDSTINLDEVMDEDRMYDYRMSQQTSAETESVPSASNSPINTDFDNN